ncbi:MAG TPA: zinc ribbon domain-containing protein [Candidatus Sulfotelmatobacter sp.]|nr:zinc ribbon domain-containing protein [Candidatus Sulfotelmatobacter sp.]
MAFCNSCGATLNEGTKFCNKCGAAVSGAPAPVMSAPAAGPTPSTAPSQSSSSALKIILIVVAVIVVLGILGVASIGFIGYRIAKHSRVQQNGDNVKVETPFGNVETTQDPAEAAKNLGIDLYPGAQTKRGGTSSVSFGSYHTVTALFTSTDNANKVCDFYKSKFPGAMVTSSDQNRCTIVSNDSKNMVTINVEPDGDGSKFQITNVSKGSK